MFAFASANESACFRVFVCLCVFALCCVIGTQEPYVMCVSVRVCIYCGEGSEKGRRRGERKSGERKGEVGERKKRQKRERGRGKNLKMKMRRGDFFCGSIIPWVGKGVRVGLGKKNTLR